MTTIPSWGAVAVSGLLVLVAVGRDQLSADRREPTARLVGIDSDVLDHGGLLGGRASGQSVPRASRTHSLSRPSDRCGTLGAWPE